MLHNKHTMIVVVKTKNTTRYNTTSDKVLGGNLDNFLRKKGELSILGSIVGKCLDTIQNPTNSLGKQSRPN